MPGPLHFEEYAGAYERGRPAYPVVLWERLTELGLLSAGVRVLELGAGTGLATGPMVRAGAVVTAVEPGPTLADGLRRRWPEATVYAGTAEDVELPTAAYGLAVVATAVHWLDLDVVLPKVHRALVPGGHLAVWRTAFGDPTVPVTPFRERVAAIVARRGQARVRSGPGELATDEWARLLGRSGHFGTEHVAEFRWAVELRTEQVRDLFTTFSDWDPAEVAEAARAVDELGGAVTEHYVTPLIVLGRVAD